MEDTQIMMLFWQRSQQAVTETTEKYGKLIRSISRNILHNEEDVSECENDTYMALWNSIPPERPDSLLRFACAVAKKQALRRYRDGHRQKRSGEQVALEELSAILPTRSLEEEWSAKELGCVVDDFLDQVDAQSRLAFIYRYWYGDSVKEIARILDISENTAAQKLSRLRKKLQQHLIKEGYDAK